MLIVLPDSYLLQLGVIELQSWVYDSDKPVCDMILSQTRCKGCGKYVYDVIYRRKPLFAIFSDQF